MFTKNVFFWSAIAVVLVAITLIIFSSIMPVYHNEELARTITSDYSWEALPKEEYDAFMENWHQRLAGVSTKKYPVLDAGQGLLSFGLALFAVYLFLVFRKLYSLKKWSTPSRRWLFILIAVVGTVLILLGAFERNLSALTRGQLPIWADSIAIPMMYTTHALKNLTVTTIVLGVIQLFRANLPVPLWIWHTNHPVTSWLTLIFYGVLGLFTAIGIVEDIIDGAWLSIPGWLIWLYILASSRAAILSWYK